MALRGGLSLKIERGCLKVHLCKQNITKIFNGFNDIMANGVGSSGRVPRTLDLPEACFVI